MNDWEQHITPDADLGRRLRALEAPPSDARVDALRVRMLAAAAPALAARARQARIASASRSSWMDITGGFSRIAIPLSLAAALLAMVLLRQWPVVTAVDDTTMAMASSVVGDAEMTPQIADELVLPENADAVLLGAGVIQERE
jgi:hypothetical protein